jgi:hypothetical protein
MDTSTFLIALITALAALLGALSPIIVALIQAGKEKPPSNTGILLPEGYVPPRRQTKSSIQWFAVFSFALLGGLVGYGGTKLFGNDINNLSTRNVTPTPARIEQSTIVSQSGLYDDFSNVVENDGIDYSRWDVYNEYGNSCVFSQNQGYLEISHSSSLSQAGCYLNKISSGQVGKSLNTWEMKVRVVSNFQGSCCGSIGLVFYSDSFSDGSGYIECSLNPDPTSNAAVFKLVHGKENIEEYRRTRSSTFDDWHSLRLVVDQTKFEASCYIDNSLVGSVIPKDKARLRNASFAQYIQSIWPPNSTGTYYIDDVLVYP